jgi:hypothetical protein
MMSPTTAKRAVTGRWWLVPAFGLAAVLANIGFADEPKPDGGKPAQKADEKKPEVLVGPPPELDALRKAVEDAARKGENVDEVRKRLDALEKALTGKAWAKPRAVEPDPEPTAPVRPAPGIRPLPPVRVAPDFPRFDPVPIPDAVFGNPEDARKADELTRKAMDLLRADPQKNRDEAEKLMREAQDLRLRAVRGRLMVVPDVGGLRGGLVINNGRLGVQIEKPSAVLAEQLNLPAGQGLVITSVRPGSPADTAGLKAHDILLEFAGKPVGDNTAEFARAVEGMKGGDKVDATVLRKGRKESVKGIDLPEVNRRPVGRLGAGPLAPPADVGPGRALSGMTFSVNNGKFTLTAERNGAKYRVEGEAGEGGKPVPTKIEVVEGEKKTEAASLDKLPADYRKEVEQMLNGVRIGGGRR